MQAHAKFRLYERTACLPWVHSAIYCGSRCDSQARN